MDNSDPTAPLADVVKTATQPPEPLPEGLSLQSGVDALRAISAAHKAELETTIDANQKNNAVIQALQTTTDQTNNDSISAYENLNKISRLPAGISRVLGFFDDGYNVNVQKNNLDISQVKLQQAAEKAKQQIQINQSEPAIAKLRSELATQDFTFQKDAFSLVSTTKGLTQKDQELRLSAARILLDMGTQEREETNFKLSGMTAAQKQAELTKQKAGKGDPFWVGKAGLLEHSINVDQQAELARDQAAVNLQKGQIDLANQKTTDMLAKIPNYILSAQIADARAKGALFIDFGKGVQVPLNQAETAFNENKKHEDETVGNLTTESNAQVLEKMGTVGTALTALAGLDPDANRIFSTYSQALTQYQAGTKDYNTSRAFSFILDDAKTKLQAIAKRVASTAGTPEAKAAVEKFGNTGAFEAAGGAAVVNDIATNYVAQTQTKYHEAYALAGKEIAARVAQQNMAGMPVFDKTKSSASQTQQMMAAIMASKDQKKIKEITEEVLADPAVQSQMADALGRTVRADARLGVFDDLAKAFPQSKIWTELRDHPENMADQNGAYSYKKLGDYLATQSAALGPNGADYGMVFAQALKTRALKSKNNPNSDPSKMIWDHALDAKLYGGNAEPAVLADFAERQRQNAIAAHQDMQKRIKQDLQTADVPKYGGIGSPEPVTAKDFEELMTRQNASASATGAPLTVGQMKLLYGGPQQPVTTGVGR